MTAHRATLCVNEIEAQTSKTTKGKHASCQASMEDFAKVAHIHWLRVIHSCQCHHEQMQLSNVNRTEQLKGSEKIERASISTSCCQMS